MHLSHSFFKLVFSCLLLHMTTPCLYVFLSREMSLQWTKQISSVSHSFWNNRHTDHFKTFSDIFDNGNSHQLALLKDYYTLNESAVCNLTVRVHNFDGKIETNTCDVIPPFKIDGNQEVSAEKVLFLKSNRVFVSWKVIHEVEGEHTLFKVISIDDCIASKFIDLKVATNTTHNIGRKFYEVIRLEDSFDVIFENFEICPRAYCKLSFSYDGEQIDNSSLSFLDEFLEENETLFINSINPIETDSGKGVVLTGNKNQSLSNESDRVRDVYSPMLGWTSISDLFSDYVFVSNYQTYSNENDFATICWRQPSAENKLSCKWLDGSHKSENQSDNIFTSEIDQWTRMPYIYNTRDGEIILINFGSENGNQFIFIDKITADSECKRIMKIFNQDGSYPQYYLLSITAQNQFCFSFITWRSNPNKKGNFIESYTYAYEFISQCIEIPNFTTLDDIKCGAGYL